MSGERTAWHPPFTEHLQARCPRWAKVTAEVQLTAEPLRVDDVIELRADPHRDPADTGETLRGMWRHVALVGLLEFKSISRPFRRGDLHRLLAYATTWLFARQPSGESEPRLGPRDLSLILAVPSVTPTLYNELTSLELVLPPTADGYHVMIYGTLRLVVVDLGVIAEREDDDLLRLFAGHAPQTLVGRSWMMQYIHRGQGMSMKVDPSLPGYDDMMAIWLRSMAQAEPELFERVMRRAELPAEQRLAGLAPEQRLAGLAPEQRLAGLAPEQRLAGLAPEQRLAGLSESEQVLALPDRLLRGLSDSYVATLPFDTQEKIHARLKR